ncbi:MAG TPA: FAD-binding oxidoreductase [Aliidongia sp.]|uniref:NAD(P)/FAD-dependent oxidoreductase n=1 Tax=Aliidongia sp. TaxID=1914230 RepID=UPI002DDD05FF|nr:FAD-binding oxidoreductase [Aliidongia sp.]HEV2678599.1 FAD-binding oxidoreductase [Aliidongia sp.]
MHQFDFLIVGAGIAGAGIALELAGNARIAVLEREAFPGYHTTGRSAALFSESYGNAPIRALTSGSRAFFEAPPQGFTEHPLVTPRGCLFIAREDQLAALEDHRRISPPSVEMLDRDAVRRLIPSLRADYLAAGLLDASVMDIDVHALHQGFLRGARSAGARLVTSAEVEDVSRRDGVWQVTSTAGAFAAPILINAAGAWAEELGAMAGTRPIGLTPLRRTALLIDPPADLAIGHWPAVIDVDEEFYFKPDAGKLLVSPADETPSVPCDAQAEELDMALGIDRMQKAIDLPVRRISRSWAGLRSFVADRTPVVGFDPQAEGFFWLAGQGGYGIQTAPAMARLAAALARGEPVPGDLVALGVDRAALSPARLTAALQGAVR